MKRSAIVFTTKQIIKMVDNGTYSLNSDIQRRSGVWVMGSLKASLLIHSILAGFVIPPMYIVREDTGEKNEKGKSIYKSSVIDGKQRITLIKTFVNNEWSLDVGTPNIILEDKEIEIAGRTFSELDEEVQDEILSFNFNIYNLDDCTDEEIEECFFRLNNGVVLTKGEQSKAKIGLNAARFINSILGSKLFTEIAHFTPAQLRRSADQLTLMQTMLLIDVLDEEYEDFTGISESAILDYSQEVHGTYDDEKQNRIRNIVEYLEEAIKEKNKFLKKINLPMVMIVADKAIQENIDSESFGEWFTEFVDLYDPTCEYAQYCGSGSVKRDNTLKRIEVMTKSFEKFCRDNIDGYEEDTYSEDTQNEDTYLEEIKSEDTQDEDTCSGENSSTSFTDDLLNDSEN